MRRPVRFAATAAAVIAGTAAAREFAAAPVAGEAAGALAGGGSAGAPAVGGPLVPRRRAGWRTAAPAAAQGCPGFQGVFADNATTGYGASVKYPTGAAVQSAMASMLARVGPALRAQGLRVLANLGNNNVDPALWGKWLRYVSGFQNEFRGLWPGNSPQNGWYQWTTHEVKACVRQRKVCEFHAGDHSIPLSAAQRNYLTATLLLFTNGRQYLAYAGDSPPASQTRLGAATGPAHRARDGLWRRRFACGSVTVRPAGDGTRGTGTVKVTC